MNNDNVTNLRPNLPLSALASEAKQCLLSGYSKYDYGMYLGYVSQFAVNGYDFTEDMWLDMFKLTLV